MKTTLVILLSGALFAVVHTWIDPCPVNEMHVSCEPCESFCNEEPFSCITVCIDGSFCKCLNGYSRISRNNQTCVPKESCHLFAE